MTFLPDVNVWIALAVGGHVHHAAAKAWFEAFEDDAIAFCRITQMGFLRLLTNPHVMGDDALTADRSWEVFDALARDTRVRFAPEPPDLEARFRQLTRRRRLGANFWADAYLAAFVSAAGSTLVTFDSGFRQYAHLRLRLLR